MARGSSSSGGGESKQGLIITLIFFVLATIILGVTTYLGFDGQAELKKQADAANSEKTKWEARSNWHEFCSKIYRAYAGHTLQKDVEKLGLLREQHDNNRFASVDDPAREDITKQIKELDQNPDLGWNPAEKKPKETYAGLVAALRKANDDLKKSWDAEKGNVKKATDELAAAQDELRKYRDEWNKKVKAAEAKVLAEQEKVRDQLAMLQTQLEELGKEREDLKGQVAKVVEDTGKQVAKLNRQITDQRLKLEKAEAEVAKKVSLAINLNEPHGKIVSFDPTDSDRPFINLGAVDNVKTGLTFSVFGVGPDGKALKDGKATVEVVRVINDHLSQVRVTGYADRYRDPLVRGDLLFNPAWSPTQKKHVAVVGIIDLDDDKVDDIQEFLRNLTRFNVTVDAWLDLKTLKEEGNEITRRTEYLVLGDNPPAPLGGREDDERGRRHTAKLEAMGKMQQKAIDNGVTIITLRNFLALTGYPVPKTGPILGAQLYPDASTTGSPIEKLFEKKP